MVETGWIGWQVGKEIIVVGGQVVRIFLLIGGFLERKLLLGGRLEYLLF